MKTFKQLINEAKQQLDIQENTINYIPVEDLKKYLTAADKFISAETKELINYLIVNNAHYVEELTDGNEVENALAYFYENGPYKEQQKQEIYKLLFKIIKEGRMLEIPVFQTEEQFNGIISKTISPDEIILDLTSEKGRNLIAKRYEGLVKKIAGQFANTVNIPFEDLVQSGFIGLIHAMNHYGKKYGKVLKKEEETGEETVSMEQYKNTTFLTYASFAIRNFILDSIKNDAHTVRIPVNQQKSERDENDGVNVKHRSISGDKAINNEEGGKTLFDFVGGIDSSNKSINHKDIERCWKLIIKALIDSKDLSNVVIYCWLYSGAVADYVKLTYNNGKDLSEANLQEINDLKLEVSERTTIDKNTKTHLSNTELSKKLNKTPSNITYYVNVVNNYIRNNKRILAIAQELRDLYYESKQIKWQEEIIEPIKITTDNTKIDY